MWFRVLFIVTLFIAPVSWSVTNEVLIQTCWTSAEEKLIEKAELKDCNLQINEMKVEAIDNRWYNPSKYVWFSCPADCADDRAQIEVMVQYYRSRCD